MNLLLLSIILSRLLQIQSAAIDECKTALKEFAHFGEITFDVVKEMQLLKSHLPHLLRLVGPAGIVLAEIARLGLRPESDELKAIKELQNIVINEFSILNNRIQDNYHAAEYEAQLRQYKTHVANKLIDLQDGFSLIKHSNVPEDNDLLDEFVSKCKTSHDPTSILRFIQLSIESCPIPNAKQGVVYGKLRQMFSLFEKRHPPELLQQRDDEGDYNGAENGFRTEEYEQMKMLAVDYLMAHSSVLTVENKIKQIEKEILAHNSTNYERIFKILLPVSVHQQALQGTFRAENEPRGAGSGLFSCFLNAVAFNFDHKRAPMVNVVSILKTDILKTLIMGTMCVASKGSASYRNSKIELQLSIAQNVISRLISWIENKLIFSWPEIIKEEAITAIGNKKFADNEFESVAEKIVLEADQRGELGFGFNVIVARSEYEWQHFCTPKNCSDVAAHSNIKFLISRFNISESRSQMKVEGAKNWCIKRVEEIRKRLNDNANSNDVANAIGLQGYIKSHIYNTVLLLHYDTIFGTNCEIKFGVAQTTHFWIEGAPHIDTYCYFDKYAGEIFGKADCFEVYFAR